MAEASVLNVAATLGVLVGAIMFVRTMVRYLNGNSESYAKIKIALWACVLLIATVGVMLTR
jgi:hypothetical protein